MKAFGADFAYTVDGGALGGIEYENFNAANLTVTFHGRSVHTGDARHKMINALTLASEWQQLLPTGDKPEYTEGYEGFYHDFELIWPAETETEAQSAAADFFSDSNDTHMQELYRKLYYSGHGPGGTAGNHYRHLYRAVLSFRCAASSGFTRGTSAGNGDCRYLYSLSGIGFDWYQIDNFFTYFVLPSAT